MSIKEKHEREVKRARTRIYDRPLSDSELLRELLDANEMGLTVNTLAVMLGYHSHDQRPVWAALKDLRDNGYKARHWRKGRYTWVARVDKKYDTGNASRSLFFSMREVQSLYPLSPPPLSEEQLRKREETKKQNRENKLRAIQDAHNTKLSQAQQTLSHLSQTFTLTDVISLTGLSKPAARKLIDKYQDLNLINIHIPPVGGRGHHITCTKR